MDTYRASVTEMLSDQTTYKPVLYLEDPTPQREKACKVFVDGLAKRNEWRRPLKTKLTPAYSRTPVLYTLWKVHKDREPGQLPPPRPINSQCGGPTETVSWLACRILTQLVELVPTNLKNSSDFVTRLRQYGRVPPHAVLYSLDVKSLYPSIDTTEAMPMVREFAEEHWDEIDSLGLTVADLMKCLNLVIDDNVFRFHKELFQQTHGVAMGVSAAPPFAIIFMHKFWRRAIEGHPQRIQPYDSIYIDDSFGYWTASVESLEEYVRDYLNSVMPSIQFTIELARPGEALAFLDTTVTNVEGELQTGWYQKPMASGIVLNYLSHHPLSTKLGVAAGMFLTAGRNCSTPELRADAFQRITSILLTNNYPRHLVTKQRRGVERKLDAPLRQHRDQQRKDPLLIIPFVSDGLTRAIRKEARALDLNARVVCRSAKTLRSELCRSDVLYSICPTLFECSICRVQATGQNNRYGTCIKRDLVYRLTCHHCPATYCGETSQPLGERCKQHSHAVYNDHQSYAMAKHYATAHPEAHAELQAAWRACRNNMQKSKKRFPFSVEVIQQTKGTTERKICESIRISMDKPSININAGWEL